MRCICVFASGTGSNFDAIVKASKQGILNANISLLVSDKPNSKAVEKARNYGIDVFTFHPKMYKSKEDFEILVLQELQTRNIDLIVLAGYMRLIGHTLLKEFPKRIINIHPSLLPMFKGKDAIGQAMNAKTNKTGVTVHYVDEGMDTGEIIKQVELDISTMNTREEIEKNIHEIEHALYKEAINMVLEEL
jgi:phosphoribosylglycinamide formyltransferase-1